MTAVTLPADQVEALLAVDGDAWLAVKREQLCDVYDCGLCISGKHKRWGPPAWCVGKCETCRGSGREFVNGELAGVNPERDRCQDCHGTGSELLTVKTACEMCDGAGWLPVGTASCMGCPDCHGSGLRRVEIGHVNHTFEIIEVLPVVDKPTWYQVGNWDNQSVVLGDYGEPYLHETAPGKPWRGTFADITPIGTPEPDNYVVRLRKVEP